MNETEKEEEENLMKIAQTTIAVTNKLFVFLKVK